MPLLIDGRKPTISNQLIKDSSKSVADSLSTLAIVLDSVVDIAESDTDLGNRLFRVPDPGAFVNHTDNLNMDVRKSTNDRTVES